MKNNEILKKQIIYRSTHRGSKELDLLLGNFVKKYIDKFDECDLRDLEKLLLLEDEIIYKWYFENNSARVIQNNKVSLLLKKFKF